MTTAMRALIFNGLALLAVCATGTMEWWGQVHGFFLTYVWWDILTHMLGGLTVGLWGAAVATRLGLSPYRAGLLLLGLIVIVGITWEVWEEVTNLRGNTIDTVADLGNNTLGAFFAWVTYTLSRRST